MTEKERTNNNGIKDENSQQILAQLVTVLQEQQQYNAQIAAALEAQQKSNEELAKELRNLRRRLSRKKKRKKATIELTNEKEVPLFMRLMQETNKNEQVIEEMRTEHRLLSRYF